MVLVSACSLAAASVSGAPATFNIDPAQSIITASGNAAGFTFQEQGPGSLTTSIMGTIQADVTSSTIQFTGGSSLDAVTNGVWEPGTNGDPGMALADFGGHAGNFLASVDGAFRDIVLDVTSPLLVVTNNQFDSMALVFSFPSNSIGHFDYNAGSFGSGSSMFSGAATNDVLSGASLTTTGGVQTLTIQVDASFVFGALVEDDSILTFTGQLVATRSLGPQIDTISVSSQQVLLTVSGPGAPTYQLQSSTNLVDWAGAQTTVATNGQQYLFSTTPSGPIQFFRLAAGP